MRLLTFLKRNRFVLSLLALFLVTDALLAWWNPMERSRRFYKNDFVKTLYHHGWTRSGPVFYGNSSVTAAYMEDRSTHKLTEMGLSYGKITDLQAILKGGYYDVERELVVGIDVHTMIDSLETDPTYPWFKRWYQPYVYYYRDYFRDSGQELLRNALKGHPLAYEPRWIDKMLYFGPEPTASECPQGVVAGCLQRKWDDYDKRFGWMKPQQDFRGNLAAMQWVIDYAASRKLPLRVVWMPWNSGYKHPPYVAEMKSLVNGMLQKAGVPTLDLMDRFPPEDFHELVHLNREKGAPEFTKEVDAWLNGLK
ncbi:hypothetical protein SD70_32245 [Gordoniibacillus kamchatkensis]|uniref:Uncharacterized protein n=1 Tax=Gordoniibacillus kamchatkensis TaxID=1590651 RepID=A0ABR5A2S7_9BACL|nr:hypothetical protein [Paenibacillus sp. VKM B-2647]KIL35344.1 hypothetical protein SD70_32245 [Paenibacillus sp. VKM B-2647]